MKFLSRAVHGKTASMQVTVEVREAKMGERQRGIFVSMFAVTAPLLLGEAGMKQIRQILQALTAVHTYAAKDMCLCE